jgi:uncharacterized protein (DUF305 family)
MNKNTWIIVIVSLIIGAGVGSVITKAVVNKNNSRTSMMTPAADHQEMAEDMMAGNSDIAEQMHVMMVEMNSELKNKQGTEFDKAFIAGMIEHHQGAVDMANLALTNAKHQEIKNMAKDIISAQTNEMDQLKQWQQNWFK